MRVWAHAARHVRAEYGSLPDESRRYVTIRTIIDMQIRDVVQNSEALIQKARVKSADEVRLYPRALIAYSPERRLLNLELRDYLYKNLYFNPVVHEPNLRAVKMLGKLFNHYLAHPADIGESSQKRVRRIGARR